MKQEIAVLKGSINSTQNYSEKLVDRIDYLDDGMRKKNLIITGVGEEAGENSEKCQQKLLRIIRDKMNMSDIRLSGAFHIDKSGSNSNWNILVKFSLNTEISVFR